MNSKTLFVCLLVLALAISSVQGLTIRKTSHQRAAKHMARKFLTGFNHMMSSAIHRQSDDDEGSLDLSPQDAFVNDFTKFALGDPEIFSSILGGKPLSEEAAQRIKDFIKGNDNFYKEMNTIFDDQSNPECVKSLSDAQQKKIVGIIVDNLDIMALVNGGQNSETAESSLDDATMSNIEDAIRNDQDLGDSVADCYKENEGSLKPLA